VLVAEATAPALANGLRRALAIRFDPAAIRRHAQRFGRERFAAEIGACVEETLTAPAGTHPW
ncbi:MAG: hypothetical protein KGN76_13160, partial [Acidobacteriota bacterium]|nr:hypothetical protein [Acidobacteriota bacterium]